MKREIISFIIRVALTAVACYAHYYWGYCNGKRIKQDNENDNYLL